MRVVLFAGQTGGVWLLLFVVSRLAPDALSFTSWTGGLKLALAIHAASGVAVWLADRVWPASITTALRGVARAAVRFAVPAFGLATAARLVSGVDVGARWPALLLGGLCAAWPLYVQLGKFLTRPGHAAACAIDVGDETLVAVGDWGHRAGLIEPATKQMRGAVGRLARVLPASGLVLAVCQVRADDRTLLAVGSDDRVIRLWDPVTGERVHVLTGHRGAVHALCTLDVDGTQLLASGSDDRIIRLWNPVTGRTVGAFAFGGAIRGLCRVQVGGATMLASAGTLGAVRLWDPRTMRQEQVLIGARGWLHAVCTVQAGDRLLVAAAGQDGFVHIWDPETREHLHALAGLGRPVYGLSQVSLAGRTLLASAGDGGGVLLWDPLSGERLGMLGDLAPAGNPNWYRALCEVRVGGTVYIVASGHGEIVDLWSADDDEVTEAFAAGSR